MSGCGDLRALLGGYVLEALEPDEAAAVREHLRTCPACAAEHAQLAELPRLIDLAGGLDRPAEPLSPAVEEALLDRYAREVGARPPRVARHRRRRRPGFAWTRPRVAVASAVVAAALGAGTVAVLDDDPAPTQTRSYEVTLRGTAAAPGASARMSLERVGGGTEVRLWAKGLEPGPEGVYEMFCEGRGWSASAGTFRADAHGRVYAVLTTAARVGEYERIRVVYRRRARRTTEVLTGRLF
jgi:hypothetical protein